MQKHTGENIKMNFKKPLTWIGILLLIWFGFSIELADASLPAISVGIVLYSIVLCMCIMTYKWGYHNETKA